MAVSRFTADQLERARRELDARLSELQLSDYNGFHNALQRFLLLFERDLVLSRLVTELPTVDFASWYAEAESTVGGMAGSGRLDWPLDDESRIAMQKALLDQVASRQIDLGRFTKDFMYTGSPQLSTRVQVFVQRVVEPFARGVGRRLEETPRSIPLGERLRLLRAPVKWVFGIVGTAIAAIVVYWLTGSR